MKQLLFFTFLLVFSQLNAQILCKSYLILSNKDSVEGFVQRQRDVKMSKGIWFSKENDAKKLQFISPDKIEKLHLIKEDLTYQSVNYTIRKDTQKIREKRLAKLMEGGFCYLFRLALPFEEQQKVMEEDNDHVYIVRKNGFDYILKINEKIINTAQDNRYVDGAAFHYTNQKFYRSRLLNLTSDMPELKPKIESLYFTDKHIGNIINSYNAKNQQFNNYFSQNYKTKRNIRNQYFVGLMISTLFNEKIKQTSFDIGYSREIGNIERNEKASLQFGVGANILRKSIALSFNTNIYQKSFFQQGFFATIGANLTFFNVLPIVGASVGVGYNTKKVQYKVQYINELFFYHAAKVTAAYSF